MRHRSSPNNEISSTSKRLAERFVQTSTRLIKKLLNAEEGEWDKYVPAAQLFINLKVATAHGSAPFNIMFGRPINSFSDHSTVECQPDFDELKNRLSFAQEIYSRLYEM